MSSKFLSVPRLVGWAIALVAIVGVVVMMKMRAAQESNPSDIPKAPPKGDVARYLAATSTTWPAWSVKAAEDVPAALGRWVGSQMELAELLGPESGLAFVGAENAAVPGPGKSAVLGFKAGSASVTVFVQQYTQMPALERGITYRLPATGAQQIIAALPAGKIFFIASSSAEGLAAATKAMGLPAPSKDY